MSKNYTVMELEAIKHLCKCVNSVASLPADLIADTNVATNTTYSSYKIDAEMSALENDIQRYVDTALAGLNKLSKEVIDDKALVVKENVLYLYKDPLGTSNDYMQMMLINGVVVELGSTTCDMSSVYSKDDVDAKFALKIDLNVLTTSFNNLVTSIEKKIDKTDIVDNLTSTDTDKPLSANQGKVLKTELDKTNAKLDEKADKTESDGSKKLYITNTGANIKFVKITSAPTNGSSIDIHFKSGRTNTTFEEETVRVSKYASNTVYDGKIIQKGLYAANGNKPTESEANFLVILDDYSVWAHIASYSTAEIELYSYGRKQSIDGTEATTLPSKVKYSMFNGAEIVTTSVADVGVTTITPVNSAITGTIEYTVKNGICYVSMDDLTSTISSTKLLISNTMPKPSINCAVLSVDAGGSITRIYIDKNTTNLYGNFYTKNAKSNCSFSYPVAE